MQRKPKVWEKIENWIPSIFSQLPSRIDQSIWFLISAVCIRILDESEKFSEDDLWKLDLVVLHSLLSLQTALSQIATDLPDSQFDENAVSLHISKKNIEKFKEIQWKLLLFSIAQDALFFYQIGLFEIKKETETSLFLRPADKHQTMIGIRDVAQTLLKRKLSDLHIDSKETPLNVPEWYRLYRLFKAPEWLEVGGLSSDEFIRAWCIVGAKYKTHWIERRSLVTNEDELVTLICRDKSICEDKARIFINLLTFQPDQSSHLTLFHTPFVYLTRSSIMVIGPSFAHGDPILCLTRIASAHGSYPHDKVGLFYQNEIEAFYKNENVQIKNDTYSYIHENKNRAIDLVIYDHDTNRILISQVKSFIPPLTAREKSNADKKLGIALDQIIADRDHLKEDGWDILRQRLGISKQTWENVRISPTVIGNGFSGSDLIIEAFQKQGCNLVDGQYVLFPEHKGRSIFEVIEKYSEELEEAGYQALMNFGHIQTEFGGLTINFPSWYLGPGSLLTLLRDD